MLTVTLADKSGLKWAQEQVVQHHYLHTPVDDRCSPVALLVTLFDHPVGCQIFGRPEATRVNGWYGSVEDVQMGKCLLTRWEVLNLARVWPDPSLQHEGKWYYSQGLIGPSVLPGFYDRKRHWHSSTASYVIDLAVEQIVFHYLMFSVIDQCKLTTTIFLYHLTYCSVLETALVQVLPPKEPDQVCQSLATINKVRTLKFS